MSTAEQTLATCREALTSLTDAERQLVMNWLNSEFRAPVVFFPAYTRTWPNEVPLEHSRLSPGHIIDTAPNTGGPVYAPPCRVTCGSEN